jgi:hypothetical protein
LLVVYLQKQQVNFVQPKAAADLLTKMGWKSSIAIHLGFWLYLVGGGLIYYYIENPMYHLPPVEKRKNKRAKSFLL